MWFARRLGARPTDGPTRFGARAGAAAGSTFQGVFTLAGSSYPLIPSEVQAALAGLGDVTGSSWTFQSQQSFTTGMQPIVLDGHQTSLCEDANSFPVPSSSFCEPICSSWVDIGVITTAVNNATTVEGAVACV